jgi:hypothetical protein
MLRVLRIARIYAKSLLYRLPLLLIDVETLAGAKVFGIVCGSHKVYIGFTATGKASSPVITPSVLSKPTWIKPISPTVLQFRPVHEAGLQRST